MVSQKRLNDAAIALHHVLSQAGINFGIFSGYAIGAIGGVRESKDVDCLASVSKEQVVQLLNGKNGFSVIPQTRQDYVAFLWSAKPGDNQAVLVEIFCENFPGAEHNMSQLQPIRVNIEGHSLGNGSSMFLEPFYLFKGKVWAAASRNKFHDSADLRMLVTRFDAQIRPHVDKLDLRMVGLAMKRYLILENLFKNLGVNVDAAKQAAANLDPSGLSPPHVGDVQKGLLS